MCFENSHCIDDCENICTLFYDHYQSIVQVSLKIAGRFDKTDLILTSHLMQYTRMLVLLEPFHRQVYSVNDVSNIISLLKYLYAIYRLNNFYWWLWEVLRFFHHNEIRNMTISHCLKLAPVIAFYHPCDWLNDVIQDCFNDQFIATCMRARAHPICQHGLTLILAWIRNHMAN